MALKTHYRAVIASLICCSPAVIADVTPVRSLIESRSDIQLNGADKSDAQTAIDQQDSTSNTLGPAISIVSIDSNQGFYTATTGTNATFDGPSEGSFMGTASYQGSRGEGDVNATSWDQTLWCIYEYDFTIPDTGMLDISGTMFNGGPSSISYFGFVQVFTEEEQESGFDESIFVHEIFDFGMDGQNINLHIPLTEPSKSYRLHVRIGHIGTTILDADLSRGTISIDWTIDAPEPCRVDMDGDGELDFFDVSIFFDALINQDATADFNGDGSLDFFDVSLYLIEFQAGCSLDTLIPDTEAES